MPDPLKYLTAFVIILFVSQTGKTQSKDPDPPAKSHVPDEKKAEVTDTGMAPKVRYLDTVYERWESRSRPGSPSNEQERIRSGK